MHPCVFKGSSSRHLSPVWQLCATLRCPTSEPCASLPCAALPCFALPCPPSYLHNAAALGADAGPRLAQHVGVAHAAHLPKVILQVLQ